MLNTWKQQKEHGINLNRKKTAALLLASYIMLVLVVSVGVYAASISNIQTIGQGITLPNSYTVYEVSGTYYAKDQNGYVEFSGSNPSTVTNSAIDGLTLGRTGKETVKLIGEYTLTEPINVTGFTILDLTDAKLFQGASSDTNMIVIEENSKKCEIIGGWIEMDKVTNTLGNGIYGTSGTQEVLIDGVKIRYAPENGIRIGSSGNGLYWITRCYITSSGAHGIYTSSFSDSFIIGNDIGNHGLNGIYMGSSGGNRITSNGLWLNNADGGNAALYLYECRDTMVGDNWFHDNYQDGLEVHGTTDGFNVRTTICGNDFRDNGELTTNTYYDLKLSGGYTQQNTIIGNVFYSPEVKYNIFFTGTDPYPTNNTIVGNTCIEGGYVTLSMAATGTFLDNVIQANVGYADYP